MRLTNPLALCFNLMAVGRVRLLLSTPITRDLLKPLGILSLDMVGAMLFAEVGDVAADFGIADVLEAAAVEDVALDEPGFGMVFRILC